MKTDGHTFKQTGRQTDTIRTFLFV